jgi:hydroxymethylbilane synthase
MTTEGDISKELLSQIGGTGVFASELRKRLLAGQADFAVQLVEGPADRTRARARTRRGATP